MSEWFEKAFGEDYLNLYAHRDAAEAERVVELVLSHTSIPSGGTVLDAPCGAGRHLQAFQARGFRAFGFDLSRPLLREAKQAVAEGTIVRTDLRWLPFQSGSCDLVVNLFSSLGYFSEDAENLAVLDSLVKLCRPGGWIVIDFMHSEYLRANLRKTSERTTESGLLVRDRRSIDGAPPRVNKHTTVRHPDGREDTFEESVRLFSPDELRRALANSGVRIAQEFGSYNGENFSQESQRIILIGQRH